MRSPCVSRTRRRARSTAPQVTSRPSLCRYIDESSGVPGKHKALAARLQRKTAEAYRRLWPRLEKAAEGAAAAMPAMANRTLFQMRSTDWLVTSDLDLFMMESQIPSMPPFLMRMLRAGYAAAQLQSDDAARVAGWAEGSTVDAAELGGTPDVFDCYFGKHATKADPVPGLMHGHQYVNPAFTVLLNRRASAAPPCIGCPEK